MPQTGDDVRPIPQGANRPSAPEVDHDPVYVVDVRRRRFRSSSSAGSARRRGPRPVGLEPPHSDTPPDQRSRPATGQRHPTVAPYVPAPRRPRRRTVLRFAGVLAGLLIAWLAFEVYAPWNAWSAISRVDSTPTGARGAAVTAGQVYLLVGSDSRAGLTSAQKSELGTGSVAGQRTDSIILVYVPSGGGKSALISIPRDSYVPIPGHGSNKINAAYSIGGPKLLVATIEQATDLHIDGYVEIGFGGFAGVVDSLGGVTICVPFHMNDPKAHIDLKKGCQNLNGPNALGYVRARYSDPRGDIGRAERQRQFLGAIMKKIATPSTVLVPTRWWDTTHSVAQAVVVGQDTTLSDATRVVLALRSVSTGDALSLVVPLASVNYQTPAGDSVKWDTPRAKALFTMLRRGEPLTAAPPGTDGKPSGG